MNELKVCFQPVAAEEMEAAILWYGERSPRFPYRLIYRIRPDWIEVIGIAHGRRRQGYWKSGTDS